MKNLHHWINGKPSEGSSARYGPVHNPATGTQEKQVPFASVDEVDAAVAAATDASPGTAAPPAASSWRSRPAWSA
ncbi:hypothetical protein ABT121_03910 [Streptomyces sp. NPDC001928]|uniref:hypothetical protein n=1 Tax=Streptomyces sp. NPDC001928 TaxID=3154404 RepID=UPI00332781E4